jgi:hypothetical protein
MRNLTAYMSIALCAQLINALASPAVKHPTLNHNVAIKHGRHVSLIEANEFLEDGLGKRVELSP